MRSARFFEAFELVLVAVVVMAIPARVDPSDQAAVGVPPFAVRELIEPIVHDTHYAALGPSAPQRGTPRALRLWLDSGNHPWSSHPNAWVFVPSAFDPKERALHAVVLFHGYHNCIDSYVSDGGRVCTPGDESRTGYDLPRQIEKSGTKAIVIVPQLAYDAPSSDPGVFQTVGGLRSFLSEAVKRALGRRYEDLDRVALVASSGGYQALLPALDVGGVGAIRDVFLLDALYVESEPVTRFLRQGAKDFAPGGPHSRRFGLIYCRKGSGTAQSSAKFGWHVGGWVDHEFLAFEPYMRSISLDDLRVPVFIYSTTLEHDQVVNEYFWRWLVASEI
jgi:hypothetical protein